jgi:hypothetical protein
MNRARQGRRIDKFLLRLSTSSWWLPECNRICAIATTAKMKDWIWRIVTYKDGQIHYKLTYDTTQSMANSQQRLREIKPQFKSSLCHLLLDAPEERRLIAAVPSLSFRSHLVPCSHLCQLPHRKCSRSEVYDQVDLLPLAIHSSKTQEVTRETWGMAIAVGEVAGSALSDQLRFWERCYSQRTVLGFVFDAETCCGAVGAFEGAHQRVLREGRLDLMSEEMAETASLNSGIAEIAESQAIPVGVPPPSGSDQGRKLPGRHWLPTSLDRKIRCSRIPIWKDQSNSPFLYPNLLRSPGNSYEALPPFGRSPGLSTPARSSILHIPVSGQHRNQPKVASFPSEQAVVYHIQELGCLQTRDKSPQLQLSPSDLPRQPFSFLMFQNLICDCV